MKEGGKIETKDNDGAFDLEKFLAEREIDPEIDIEKYKRYFDILRRNDVPIQLVAYSLVFIKKIGKIENSELIAEAEKDIQVWRKFKNFYDTINIEGQDENTGRGIIIENKKLINELDDLLKKIIEQIENGVEEINIPNRLFEIRDKIFDNSLAYGELPAVKTYEKFGRKGVIDTEIAQNRSDWLESGKPTPNEWFEKWELKK